MHITQKSGLFIVILIALSNESTSRVSAINKLIFPEDARKLAIGVPWKSSRIVGGFTASPNQFPYQVALMKQDLLLCGGSLIAKKWVLSAAYCVISGNQVVSPSQLSVVAETVDLSIEGTRRNVLTIIPHELYGNFFNDIAVLELDLAYELSSSIATIALRRSSIPGGSTVTISGWGRLYTYSPLSTVLQYNVAKTLTTLQCTQETSISSGLICLKSPVNNGACNGDSGGPAVYNNELVGVANFVQDGCGSIWSDGYALVAHFVHWFESKIK